MNNIAEVIGWKFDHQAGMRCKEIDGVMALVEFPGGVPTQADQDTWAAEYETALTADTRRNEIFVRLSEIDNESIRALRAKGVGRGKPEDDTSLASLEDEADALRLELAGL